MRPLSAQCRALSLLILLAGLLGVPLTAHGEEREPIKFPDTQYEPVDWTDLDGWDSDDHAAAFATFLASCKTLDVKQRHGRDLAPIPAALKDICERAQAAIPLDEDGVRKASSFVSTNTRPALASSIAARMPATPAPITMKSVSAGRPFINRQMVPLPPPARTKRTCP